jgi:hypothetical protein
MTTFSERIESWREEPFRVLFPLGILASIAGVSLWPLFVGKWLPF